MVYVAPLCDTPILDNDIDDQIRGEIRDLCTSYQHLSKDMEEEIARECCDPDLSDV